MPNINTHLSIIIIDDRRNEVLLLSSLSMIEGNVEDVQLNQVDLCLTFVMDPNEYLQFVCDTTVCMLIDVSSLPRN